MARGALLGLTGFSALRAALLAGAALVATRLLGPHDRGLMVLGASFAAVAALLAGMGTGSALRSSLPASGARERPTLTAAFAWWMVLSAVAAGALAVLLSALSAGVIDSGLADPFFLVALFANAAALVALTQLPDLWYAAGRFRLGSGWAAAVAGANLLGLSAGAAIGDSAAVLLLAQALAMAAAGAVQTAHLHRIGLLALRFPSWRRLLELPRRGMPALGLTLGLVVALRLDRYVLGAVAGPAQVAVYSLAITLSSVPALLAVAVGQLALQEVATGGGRAGVRQAVYRAVCWAAVASVPVGVGGWLFVVPVFGPEFAPARPLLAGLLVAGALIAPFEVLSRALVGGGWIGSAGLLGGAGCVLAVLLYTTLIPRFGAAGAVVACWLLYAGLSIGAWQVWNRRIAAETEQSTGVTTKLTNAL